MKQTEDARAEMHLTSGLVAMAPKREPFETLAVDLPAFLLHLEGNVELR
ncbi:MAG: hypothetical protein WBL40_01225 [Terrimicrobiaceae bacterium]